MLGDLHFGIKGFNEGFFDNQMKFIKNQLIPFMKENDLDTIVQLGDLFDNRKMIDIKIFNKIVDEFCSLIVENDIKLISLLGNHDIYYSSSLEINMVKYLEKLFPDNIQIFSEISTVKIGEYNYKFIPWRVKNDLTFQDLKGSDVVFGHFEIKNFEMVKGHVNKTSELSSNFFQKIPGLKRVVSGHYHIPSTDGFVMYVGTPYQLNWGDYKSNRGFYVFDGHEYEFFENTESYKFMKLKYDDTAEKILELSGFYEESKFFDSVNDLPDLRNHQVKLFINESKNKEYESVSFDLHQNGVTFDVINNVEISDLIGTDFQGEIDNIGGLELLLRTVKDKKPHLMGLLDKIVSEIGE